VVVDEPKLLRMSLRTTPLCVSTFDTMPFTVFEPSDGYGPFVSVGSARHVPLVVPELLPDPDELPLDDEPLLDVVDDDDEPSPPPPHAATSAAVPPAMSQLNTRRRC